MLQWVDTLIGIIVILLTVSLIVTIINQICIAIFNLRGWNLRNGIKLLLENINLKNDPKNDVNQLSNQILSNPLISDKWLNKWDSIFPKITGKLEKLRLASAISKNELINILKVQIDKENITIEGTKYEMEEKINDWFDTVMKRTSQVFSQNTRLISIVFSILLAFILHLDFFSIFQKISSDADLRESLVSSSSTILNQAGTVMGAPSVYTESMNQLRTEDTSRVTEKLVKPPLFNNRIEAENWLRTKLEDNMKADTLIKKYNVILNTNLNNSIKELTEQAASILDSLNKSSVQIIPQPPPKCYNFKYYCGVIIMASFLSLGAPFWFKALKTLSALRPILATKVDQKE